MGALVALAVSCGPSPAREAAPAFDLELLHGGRVSLESLRGKTVLVDFWATWCTPCVVEIPELNAVWDAWRERGVEILAISVDAEGREFLERWVREQGLHYPVALGDLDLAQAFGADEFPQHLLLGPDGRILERLPPGYHDREELEAVLARHAPG